MTTKSSNECSSKHAREASKAPYNDKAQIDSNGKKKYRIVTNEQRQHFLELMKDK